MNFVFKSKEPSTMSEFSTTIRTRQGARFERSKRNSNNQLECSTFPVKRQEFRVLNVYSAAILD